MSGASNAANAIGIQKHLTLVLTYPALTMWPAKADVRATIGVRSGTLLAQNEYEN